MRFDLNRVHSVFLMRVPAPLLPTCGLIASLIDLSFSINLIDGTWEKIISKLVLPVRGPRLPRLRCHSAAGSQFTSTRSGEQLAEICAVPSI